MKRCSGCQVDHPAENFYRCSRRSDGLQNFCKACSLASVKKYQTKKGKSLVARSVRYRIPIEDVERMLLVPACQACNRPFVSDDDLRFDHCHEGGHFRGVLCHPCNIACNGQAIEAVSRMTSCQEYLLRDLERQREQARAG